MTTPTQSIITAVKNYSSRLLNYIKKQVGNTPDAEDILQEVWFKLSSLQDLDEIKNISGWLFKTATNKIIDTKRKQQKQVHITNEDEGELNLSEILHTANATDTDSEFKNLFWETLANALQELPKEQSKVFILNELEDVSLKEIAEKENENIKTIISRKRYAVKYLQQKLIHLYPNFLNK